MSKNMDKSYPCDVHVYTLRETGIYSQIIYTGNISFILRIHKDYYFPKKFIKFNVFFKLLKGNNHI